MQSLLALVVLYVMNIPVPAEITGVQAYTGPPPDTVPAPAPAPSRSYLIFFDAGQSQLTDRAKQTIAEAAANSRNVSYVRINVNGYTDNSGTPADNQVLSVRRAQAVADQLVEDGIPRGAIVVTGFGETRPLVPHSSGVRDPQNDRVELIFR